MKLLIVALLCVIFVARFLFENAYALDKNNHHICDDDDGDKIDGGTTLLRSNK